MTEIEREEIWRCTTCGKCPQKCPRDAKQMQDMIAVRRVADCVKTSKKVWKCSVARAADPAKTGQYGHIKPDEG